jgi:N-methylhydantoinase A
LRYQGQGYELRIGWGTGAVARFHRLHARAYGYADSTRAVEIVTLRVQAVAKTRRPKQPQVALKRGDGQSARIASHRVFEEGRWRRAAIYDRTLLRPGDRFSGPAVIAELSATTYLPMGWAATVDSSGNLLLTARKSKLNSGVPR